MKKIYITLLILSTFSLNSSIWERVDGPYDFQFINSVFKLNNTLNVSSASWENVNLSFESYNWEIIDKNILSECGTVYNCVEKNNVIVLSTKSGIFVSYNSGLNWKEIEPLHGFKDIQSLIIIEETIFAQKSFYNSSLYKFEKNSVNWEKVYFNDTQDSIYADRLISDGSYIIAGDYDYLGLHKSGGGLTISSDKGKTWYSANDFNKKVNSMIIHNGTLYVGALDKHLYKSSNYGENWIVDSNKVFPVDMFYSEGKNLYAAVNSIGLQDTVTVGIHITTDNGQTWENRHNGIGTKNIRNLLSFNNKLYCLDDFKMLYESENKGLNWEKSNILTDSLTSYSFYSINDTLIVANSGKRGLNYSIDEGNNWKILGNGFSSRTWDIFKFDSVYVLIVESERTLNISTDYGLNWKNIDLGIESAKNFIKDVEMLGDTILVATIFGTRFSSDFGESWAKFHTEDLDSNYDTRNILRINDNTLLIIAHNEGMFKSKDNGQSWKRVNTDFLTIQTTQFKTFDYLKGKVFATLPNYGLFYSEDEGKTWEEVDTKISEKATDNGIIYYNQNVIISSEDGIIIFNFENNETNFFEISQFTEDNSFDTQVKDIEIQGDYLFVASDIGIFRSKLTDLGIVPTSALDSQTQRNYLYTLPPYPLPSQNEVKVQFYWDINLPMTVDDISIYDLNGRKVQTKDKLQIDKQANHYGNLTWDCSEAQPGIYIINISHGTEERAVKVVVE